MRSWKKKKKGVATKTSFLGIETSHKVIKSHNI